ncbi:MAG TPA: hypothetical protein VFQ58_10430 [Flavisolibacter sp.]|nr:hypothetical protein [Flavisolibacter sp.]
MIRYLVSVLIIALLFSSCKKELSFEAGKPGIAFMQDSLGNCLDKVVNGNYVVGHTLTDSNYISVSLFVQTKGVYSIFTDSVNGYSFKATGSFATTGLVTVRLKGSGKPASAGTDDFLIQFDSTSCPVSVTVSDSTGGTGQTGGTSGSDHFILTPNSHWDYDEYSLADSIRRTVAGQGTANGKTYQVFIDSDYSGPLDTLAFRKSGSDYYQYARSDVYSFASFDNPQPTELNFLKENLSTGQSWTSPDYSGTMNGQNAKIHYVFTCTNANATASYNGLTFSNVYQVTTRAMLSIFGSPFTDEQVLITNYYAKGVGLIYQSFEVSGQKEEEFIIKHYQVF